MTKTIPEITDEMIKRALAVIDRVLVREVVIPETMLEALAAALTPEPEIEVTEAMEMAGGKMYAACRNAEQGASLNWSGTFAADIYRAMVKAAPNGAKSAPQGVSAGAPEKATGGAVGSVAVGFPTGRTDGLTSLHIDGTAVLLDDAERKALVSLLQQPSALRREPEYYANVKYDPPKKYGPFYGMNRI